MAQAPSIKLDYRTPRVAPLTAPPRPDPALNWVALAGMAAALCLEIAALVTALMWPNLKARLCLFGVVGLAHVAFVWLCCLLARAKRYHPAWGLLGIPLIGGLAIPLLPTDEDDDRLLVGAPKAPYFVGWRHVVSVFVAYAFVLGAFWNSFESGWVLDNLYIIKYDPRTQATQWVSGFNAIAQPGVIEYFRQDYWWPKGISGLYRPLTSITYWLNWTVLGGGTDTTGMHVVNLVLH